MLSTSGLVRLAKGCAATTMGWSGKPKMLALTSAAAVNTSVITVTLGRPCFSISILSWRPHEMQDPQSATP